MHSRAARRASGLAGSGPRWEASAAARGESGAAASRTLRLEAARRGVAHVVKTRASPLPDISLAAPCAPPALSAACTRSPRRSPSSAARSAPAPWAPAWRRAGPHLLSAPLRGAADASPSGGPQLIDPPLGSPGASGSQAGGREEVPQEETRPAVGARTGAGQGPLRPRRPTPLRSPPLRTPGARRRGHLRPHSRAHCTLRPGSPAPLLRWAHELVPPAAISPLRATPGLDSPTQQASGPPRLTMEHPEPPESPASGVAGAAGRGSPENAAALSELDKPPRDRDTGEAAGTREQQPVEPASLPARSQADLAPLPSDAPASQAGAAPEGELVGASPGPQELPQSPRARQPEQDFYCVKWVPWKGQQTPIILQSANGPCPLLAIINVLFLQWKVQLPPQKEVVTSEELLAHLGDWLLSVKPWEKSEGLQLNFQQNVDDAMTVLPRLATGLDVNVRFTGVSDFEYTPECSIFDLLGIPLYHGWLVDPQSPEAVGAVGKLSYNQLVEKIITCKHSSDANLVTEGLIAEQFLESTAAQLTYHGLCELTATAKEGELSVFFRNNHFSTMTKHKVRGFGVGGGPGRPQASMPSHLYLLVTDQGFLQEGQVVWESLHSVDGDSCFCDVDFRLSHCPGKAQGAEGAAGSPEKQRQVDQDYLLALSLQQQPQVGLSDLELAQQLQREEYQQQLAGRPAPARVPAPQRLQLLCFSPARPRPARGGSHELLGPEQAVDATTVSPGRGPLLLLLPLRLLLDPRAGVGEGGSTHCRTPGLYTWPRPPVTISDLKWSRGEEARP
ncbi:Ubiquitin carboxyl-terminal hydrolase MINDY-1 [Galemys pyrenaicus]|uniref:Ubiquitin carboxyl-terminal hydrolase n=1 Tax=Galemys pyrenaicus TaxID=202257 RepID=A0A8J5ZSC6_GALPY|nr:Ubiquitin carboxyl-terminal hydrolase MINDY-1 [Galemys pyrenaicus]